MDLIDEIENFYKDGLLLLIVNVFYKYITYCLCVIYLIWFLMNIIINDNLKEIANENYSNYVLIFYSFYKMYSIIKSNSNYIRDFIITIIFLCVIFVDIINKNNLHYIHYWILYNQLISIFLFTYGTLYMIFSYDFGNNNQIDNNINNKHYNYVDFVADICSEIP